MVRILLLDCSEPLRHKLESQGFNVEAGTVGPCSGVRKLPSQVYEKDIFFYNPQSIPDDGIIKIDTVKNLSPEYDLDYLKGRIQDGATFVAFVNRLSSNIDVQRIFYNWIPFMPQIEFTSDKIVGSNPFEIYPDSGVDYLAPIVTAAELSLPVLQKLIPPKPQDYPRDVFFLFWNGYQQILGVQILRGRGRLIFLPKYESNEDVIETFLHRVVPKIYGVGGKRTLKQIFVSPAEKIAQAEYEELRSLETRLKNKQEAVRVQLATANREKNAVIDADTTAKQILTYYDYARRQDDAALYYLYKIVETIENRFGGESSGIKIVGAGTEWKAVKRLANESYRDARHAPKPGDVIKKWTDAELDKCFENVETIVVAYFATLFPPIAQKATP
jgi:hypothetical protein